MDRLPRGLTTTLLFCMFPCRKDARGDLSLATLGSTTNSLYTAHIPAVALRLSYCSADGKVSEWLSHFAPRTGVFKVGILPRFAGWHLPPLWAQYCFQPLPIFPLSRWRPAQNSGRLEVRLQVRREIFQQNQKRNRATLNYASSRRALFAFLGLGSAHQCTKTRAGLR